MHILYTVLYVCMYVRTYICMYVCIKDERNAAAVTRLSEKELYICTTEQCTIRDNYNGLRNMQSGGITSRCCSHV